VTSMLAGREIAGIAACASKDRSRQSRRFRAIGSGAWACGNCVGTVGMSLQSQAVHTCSTAASTFRQDARGDPFPCCGLQRKRLPTRLIESRACSAPRVPPVDYSISPPNSRDPPRCRDLGSMIELGDKAVRIAVSASIPGRSRSSNTRAA